MYYVNRGQIDERLQFVPIITQVLRSLHQSAHQYEKSEPSIEMFAQERALHLAIEVITDVGSLLIDGFLLRDASSYEDIVEILVGEGIFTPTDAQICLRLIRMRKALTQQYMTFDRSVLRTDLHEFAELLERFPHLVNRFIQQELLEEVEEP
jgi:uncharacterized protein YutE (UPF0331/DUF86 family)